MTARAFALCLGLLALPLPARAQGAGIGLTLREIVLVDLETPTRFGGEGGPMVSAMMLLVVGGTHGQPPVRLGGAPDPAYYVDDALARLVGFDAEAAVFAVPMPPDPANAVLWRLAVDDVLRSLADQRPEGVPAYAQPSPALAKELAALARRRARPAIALGPSLRTARRVKVASEALGTLGQELLKGKPASGARSQAKAGPGSTDPGPQR